MRYETVPLERIDFEDTRFCASCHVSLDRILLSIREVGLISPPLVHRGGRGYVIVAGWKRVLACRALGLSPILVLVTEEKSEARLLLIGLYDNLATREIGLVEKSLVLRRLLDFGLDKKVLLKKYFPLLSLPATVSNLEALLSLSTAADEIRAFVHEKGLPLPVVENLLRFEPQERLLLLPLLRPLGQNKQKEVLENLFELGHKDDARPEDILADVESQKILSSQKLSPLQKSERLRVYIRRRRYPRWSAAQEAFTQSLKTMGWPRQIAVLPSASFEDRELSVSFRFKSREEFKNCLSRLEQMAENENLSGLFRAGRQGG